MGSSEKDAASTKHPEALASELFNAVKKLRSDGIQNPDLQIPEPLLTTLGLTPDSPSPGTWSPRHYCRAPRTWR